MSIIVIFKKFLRNFKFSEILDKNLSYLYRAQNIYTAVAPATAAFLFAKKLFLGGIYYKTIQLLQNVCRRNQRIYKHGSSFFYKETMQVYFSGRKAER